MNHLKMNPTKTDFIYLGSRVQVGKCLDESINVCGDSIECSEVIKLLGIHINKHLSFKHHIEVKCQTAMYNLLRIKHRRRHLTQEAAQILVSSLVMSHLDYVNSLLYGLPDCELKNSNGFKIVLQNWFLKGLNMTEGLRHLWTYIGSQFKHALIIKYLHWSITALIKKFQNILWKC